jgi:hypothetical protein
LAVFLQIRLLLITRWGICISEAWRRWRSLGATVAEFIADEANYTSSRSVVQLSDVIE